MFIADSQEETQIKPSRRKFQRQLQILIWKSYLQRKRRWRILATEMVFAGILFVVVILEARPIFLTPLQAQPDPPLADDEILKSLQQQTELGFYPDVSPYMQIMERAAKLLDAENVISAISESKLIMKYINSSRLKNPVIWIRWKPKEGNIWRYSIRSTERAKFWETTQRSKSIVRNPHLRSGFLAVQLAISRAILEHTIGKPAPYKLFLATMPVSPLMRENLVTNFMSIILLCYTIALIPPIVDIGTIVVKENRNKIKYALRLRGVDYTTMYLGWIAYACMTAVPVCLLGSITLILVFRWVHLFSAFIFVMMYFINMTLFVLILAMFHDKVLVSCIWSTSFMLLQMFLATLLLQHQKTSSFYYPLMIIVPSLGLIHGFNYFALLQTGQGESEVEDFSLNITLVVWAVVAVIYFSILMLLQKVIVRAIGGQVSVKSLMAKNVHIDKSHDIRVVSSRDRRKLQEVDELVAKAISFQNVSKVVMGNKILNDVTFDIYRCEFTMIHCEPIQERMMNTIEDLITEGLLGIISYRTFDHDRLPTIIEKWILIIENIQSKRLTFPDSGSIFTLGSRSEPGNCFMTQTQSMGYCHRGKCLIEELTVYENIEFFIGLSLWSDLNQSVHEYVHLRTKQLLKECDLGEVKNKRVRDIHTYYKAQLCWALAILLEPRIVIIPNYSDKPLFLSIINDKIMKYRKYFTIIKICFTSINLEYADRIFVLDNKVLVFSGTPAYVFFKYGRDYRVRITLRLTDEVHSNHVNDLIENAKNAGATVRAYLGSLLILKVPVTPTGIISSLVKDWYKNANKYGISSLNITLPDTNEVVKRAIHESRDTEHEESLTIFPNDALKKISEPPTWKRRSANPTFLSSITNFKNMGWKYVTFHIHYKVFFIITLLCAFISGILIGITFSNILIDLEKSHTKSSLRGQEMSVEALMQKTTLVMQSDDSAASISVANSYALSDTSYKHVDFIQYTALNITESLTEYLINHAIDAPQLYVRQYAYGIIIRNIHDTLYVKALYSPLHRDQSAAARSLARAHMALLRHFSGSVDAAIQVTDDPLALDMTPWLKEATEAPLLIEFFIILTMCHMTLIPSKEHGLIRHIQMHAMNFSPTQYWITLFMCDIIVYFILVVLMCTTMLGVMYWCVDTVALRVADLTVVPFLLIIYGIGSIPFAYICCLGPRPALNAMAFVVIDIIFGESTSLAKYFHEGLRYYVVKLMSISPLFNMAVAFVKIKKTFIYNSECEIIQNKNLCDVVILHKCCKYCGVMQECFSRRFYLTGEEGIYMEVIMILISSFMYTSILLLWEHKFIQFLWRKIMTDNIFPKEELYIPLSAGAKREMEEVLDKRAQLHDKHCAKINTYGEYILSNDVSRHWLGMYELKNIYLGIGKGEILALAGLESQGRRTLCEVFAGDKMFHNGEVWCMSKWALGKRHHQYTRQTTICCDRRSLPFWMTVRDALEFIALLRGIPKKHIRDEVMMYIEALELEHVATTQICNLKQHYLTRLHFVAAVIAAPPVVIVDECTAYQDQSICRAMYFILYLLRKRGHAIFISSSNVESHLPVTNRIAFIIDGRIYDVDHVDNLLARYSRKGYTVVVHLKDEIDIEKTFRKYFDDFAINDVSLVLVNVQIMDETLNWADVFTKMEKLQAENIQVYSYIICSIPIDYVYNVLLVNESGRLASGDKPFWQGFKKKDKVTPSKETIDSLRKLERKYSITSLNVLPWSVIFQR